MTAELSFRTTRLAIHRTPGALDRDMEGSTATTSPIMINDPATPCTTSDDVFAAVIQTRQLHNYPSQKSTGVHDRAAPQMIDGSNWRRTAWIVPRESAFHFVESSLPVF